MAIFNETSIFTAGKQESTFKKAEEVKADIREKSLHITMLGPSYGSDINFKVSSGLDSDFCIKRLSTLARDLGISLQVSGNLAILRFNDFSLANAFRMGWSH